MPTWTHRFGRWTWLFVAIPIALIGLVVVVAIDQDRRQSAPSIGGMSRSDLAVARPPGVGDSGAAQAQKAQTEAGAPAAAGAAANDVPTNRPTVRIATMTVRAKDVPAGADRAGAIARAAGGRVDGDNRSGDGPAGGPITSASVVLRVPNTALDATLTQLSQLGIETARTGSATDVSTQQADLAARTAAAATSVARLQQLLTQSGSLSEMLSVESQLTQRQSDLESLQAQQRALADQTALSTITLSLTSAAVAGPPAPAKHEPTGFGRALADGWAALVTGWRWFVAGLGYAAPFLVLAAIGFLAVRLVRSRRPSRTPEAAPESG